MEEGSFDDLDLIADDMQSLSEIEAYEFAEQSVTDTALRNGKSNFMSEMLDEECLKTEILVDSAEGSSDISSNALTGQPIGAAADVHDETDDLNGTEHNQPLKSPLEKQEGRASDLSTPVRAAGSAIKERESSGSSAVSALFTPQKLQDTPDTPLLENRKRSSRPFVSPIPKKLAMGDPSIADKLEKKLRLERNIKKLRSDIQVTQRAIKIETNDDNDAKLINLKEKWKALAKTAFHDLYDLMYKRIEDMGGYQKYLEMNKPFQWFKGEEQGAHEPFDDDEFFNEFKQTETPNVEVANEFSTAEALKLFGIPSELLDIDAL